MTVPIDPNAPCIIGVAQQTWHLSGDEQAPEPLAMWAEMARTAAADGGALHDLLGSVGSVDVVNCMSWPYDDPCGRLCDELGIAPSRRDYSSIGGTTPQVLVNGVAERMVDGDLDVALVVGAEALDTKRRLKKAGERPAWSHRNPEKLPFPFEAPFHPTEIAHEVFQAWLTFAVRDVARRAHLGVTPDDHRRHIGELLAPMTSIAAANPFAWFPFEQSVSDLIDVTPDNRMVGYPYTKKSVSIMDVDMASATIVATHAAADRLGVPADRRVYLRGWSYAEDAIYVAEHPDLWRSPAMAHATSAALRCAAVGIDDIAHLDLYSCFASSVTFALDALGLSTTDERPVTVTGGLPFAGGAASNYMGHSIATMIDRLRSDPDSCGMVTGVGMHMTKHVAAVYSSAPGVLGHSAAAPPEPHTLDIVDHHSGPATVAAYSVVHGRSGEAEWGVLICDVDQGRCYGRVEDPELLAALERDEWVGSTVELAIDGDVNRATAS